MTDLTDDARRAPLLAATLLTGHERRRFQAEVAHPYGGGPARLAETTFGWGRDAVHTGPNEPRPGIRRLEAFEARGRKATEDRDPVVGEHIRRRAAPHAQAGPEFRTALADTRTTAGRDARPPAVGRAEGRVPRGHAVARRVGQRPGGRQFPAPVPGPAGRAR